MVHSRQILIDKDSQIYSTWQNGQSPFTRMSYHLLPWSLCSCWIDWMLLFSVNHASIDLFIHPSIFWDQVMGIKGQAETLRSENYLSVRLTQILATLGKDQNYIFYLSFFPAASYRSTRRTAAFPSQPQDTITPVGHGSIRVIFTVRHVGYTFLERHPDGLLTGCQKQLIWLFSAWRSFDFTLSFSQMAKLLPQDGTKMGPRCPDRYVQDFCS